MTLSNADGGTARRAEPVRGASGGMAGDPPARRQVLLRRLATVLVLSAGLAGVAGVAGFLAFTAQIAAREPAAVKPADAIVVLTGGPSRIIDGVALLTSGRGRRLLISGVNPSISTEEMRRALPEGERLMDCCIDLGHKALNTRGNAIEVAEWARARRFRSLLVVTSAWHMPRAMMELGRVLPEADLVAYPVVTSPKQTERWWSDFTTVRLLLKEYLKYIMAMVKIRPAQAVAATGDASATSRLPAAPASVARMPVEARAAP